MRITHFKQRALALGLAAALALVPATALAEAPGRGRGAFADTPTVTCVGADGKQRSEDCLLLTDSTILPLGDGWWLLEEASAPKDKVIEVTGDACLVCSGAVDLGSGYIHVNTGATLCLYVELGLEGDTYLAGANDGVAIANDGELGESPFPVTAFGRGDLRYLDENGVPQVLARADLAGDLCLDDFANGRLGKGVYCVSGDWTCTERLDILSDVTLVVCDGATLTCEKGIHVPAGKSLTILGQEGRGGKVVAKPDGGNTYGMAGIGGNEKESCGKVTICDVAVDAKGETSGAGIGGSAGGDGGRVCIRRARVHAVGGGLSAGIGGGGSKLASGNPGKGGTVVIEDSEVTAEGYSSAGIGGACIESAFKSNAGGGDVTILGDSVVDAKSVYGAAIGRARGGKDVGKVTLSDNLRVVDLDNGGTIAPFNLRGEYCKYRNHVRVELGESK